MITVHFFFIACKSSWASKNKNEWLKIGGRTYSWMWVTLRDLGISSLKAVHNLQQNLFFFLFSYFP